MVAGCTPVATVVPDKDPQSLWERHRTDLKQLSNWRVNGRILIRTEDESWNAIIDWRQQKNDYQVRINAPMGMGSVEISGSGKGVALRTGKGERYTASDPDQLIEEVLAKKIPVKGLRHWLLGLDDPAQPITYMKLDRMGRLNRLEQAGWDIRYNRYSDLDGRALPGKIFMQNQEATVRTVITGWEITP